MRPKRQMRPVPASKRHLDDSLESWNDEISLLGISPLRDFTPLVGVERFWELV
jgi:hypothetical protein